MRRWPILLLVLLPFAARAQLPSPAQLGDLSVGIGPAVVTRDGRVGGGATAEANLLFGLWSAGAHLRGAALDGGFDPAGGVEAGLAGILGLGVGFQRGGPSIDGLLALPVPIGKEPWFLSVGWRPSFLLRGGVIHELAIQVRWSSLLVPTDD
ncbi:hypothetical protein [Vulgatibacter incomptus]|uniref:Uncharacterized protein n=1 Tax=Vulgatibacter incomptus TaxID=1391653 RepID=A0A0K1PAX9_9BACT|nr:hypothetical protein [Vulgatibacter incomptus]AKU90680.1 hypothetical protein AKJ08_1067 [Vulgatibacter incomptus]